MISFSCRQGTTEEVKNFLRNNIRKIDIPTSRRINVSHGGFGRYTRYGITQRDYAGGRAGYIEVLEIRNPPDGRQGNILHTYNVYRGSEFTEWKTIKNARKAFSSYYHGDNSFSEKKGFLRKVNCGHLTPWFYAVGEQDLIGDYAFPEHLQDDPFYRFGSKFVVFRNDGTPSVKTCMGSVIFTDNLEYNKTKRYRIVYWDDGSTWNEESSSTLPPRRLQDDEMWIAWAIEEFHQLLAGKKTEFAINFANGNKFVGKLKKTNSLYGSAKGDYLIVVTLKGKKEPLEGWINGFVPTKEDPDVLQYVTKRYALAGKEVEYLAIKKTKKSKSGKKWSGVFF